MKWFRMYVEAVDDEKLRLLAFEDRWHFVALLCCKGAGVLDRKDHLTRRKVALKLGLSEREIDEVARRLAEVGLIDQETLEPLAWAHRQYESDTSTERVREYRKRMKRFGNVSETAQDTDTDTETEAEKKKHRPRVARPDSVSEQAWSDWLAVRKAKRAGPVTQTVIKRMQTEAGLAGISLQAAVEEAAARGWQAFKAEWVSGGRPSKVTEAEDFVAKLTGRARHANADGRAIRPTAGVLRDAGDAVDVEWAEPRRGEGGVG